MRNLIVKLGLWLISFGIEQGPTYMVIPGRLRRTAKPTKSKRELRALDAWVVHDRKVIYEELEKYKQLLKDKAQ